MGDIIPSTTNSYKVSTFGSTWRQESAFISLEKYNISQYIHISVRDGRRLIHISWSYNLKKEAYPGFTRVYLFATQRWFNKTVLIFQLFRPTLLHKQYTKQCELCLYKRLYYIDQLRCIILLVGAQQKRKKILVLLCTPPLSYENWRGLLFLFHPRWMWYFLYSRDKERALGRVK